MKKVISILLCVGIIFSLCACSVTQSDNDFVAGVYGTVSSFDPIYAESDVEKVIAHNCFEGFLRFDKTGNITLAGATAYTIDNDGLLYTFQLNPEAQWNVTKKAKEIIKSNNIDFDKTITAEDYAFGIERYINSNKSELENVNKVTVTDSHTLEIRLSKADSDFLYLLASLPIFPCDKEFYESVKNTFGSSFEEMLYNGPYCVIKSDLTQTVIEKNPVYNGNVQIQNEKVLLYTTGTQEKLVSRFTDGTYNVLITRNNADIKADPNQISDNEIWGIAFNCKTQMGDLKNLRNILIDAISLNRLDLPSFATKDVRGIIPANFICGDKKYGQYVEKNVSRKENKIDMSKRLENVLKTLKATSCEINFSAPVQLKSQAESIIKQWKEIFGEKIIVNLTTFDLENAEKISAEGNFDVAILPLKPQNKTASSVINSIKNAPCYYEDDTIKTTNTQSTVSNENASVYFAKEEEIIKDGIFIPLFYTSTRLYYKNDTDGIYLADGGSIVYFHKGVQSDE